MNVCMYTNRGIWIYRYDPNLAFSVLLPTYLYAEAYEQVQQQQQQQQLKLSQLSLQLSLRWIGAVCA